HHGSLHSFPTRRSSDLVQAENSDDYVKLLVKLSSLRNQISLTGKVYPNVQNEKNLDLILDVDRMDLRAIDRFTAGQIRKSRGFIDRKSTRLNSSHVKIS